jgi:predicted DNA-binding transcriptional regulator
VSRSGYNRYMVVVGAGRHAKFARLTDAERCAHFLGVLSVAAQSPIRGYLLIGEEEAGADEIAREAAVTRRQAQSAIEKLKRVGVLQRDGTVGAWFVHDWSDVNPEPKSDPAGAKRQAAYRARRQARNGSSNAMSNAPRNAPVTGRVTP